MLVKVTLLTATTPFTNKAGKSGHRAPCTFDDSGARYPLGRGTLYADHPIDCPKAGTVVDARLLSYDHGEARFAV